jgi:hypothetical protein
MYMPSTLFIVSTICIISLSITLKHKQLKFRFYGICSDSQPELIHRRKSSLKFQFWVILIIYNVPLILDAIIYMYSCTINTNIYRRNNSRSTTFTFGCSFFLCPLLLNLES